MTAETGRLPVDQGRDRGCGVGLLAGEDVAVHVEGECDLRVAEALGRDTHVRAGGEEMRRVCVAQVVQTDAGEARPLHQPSERGCHHIGMPTRPLGIVNTRPVSIHVGPPRTAPRAGAHAAPSARRPLSCRCQ